jgi:glycosyltransferase involved in cell wall biosynthesis
MTDGQSKRAAAGFRACVIVPAYDAEVTVGAVVASLRGLDLPILVVDDGSRDGTARAAERAGATVIAHSANRGKGAALVTGLRAAAELGAEAALTVDADGQHPLDAARVVLSASPDPRALVLGIRDLRRDGAPRKNRFSNGVSNFFLSKFTGVSLRDTQCGLRRYPISDTLALGVRASGYAFEAEVLLLATRAGVPLVQTPVPVLYPADRTTHFDSVRDPARIIAAVLRAVASAPLRGRRP